MTVCFVSGAVAPLCRISVNFTDDGELVVSPAAEDITESFRGNVEPSPLLLTENTSGQKKDGEYHIFHHGRLRTSRQLKSNRTKLTFTRNPGVLAASIEVIGIPKRVLTSPDLAAYVMAEGGDGEEGGRAEARMIKTEAERYIKLLPKKKSKETGPCSETGPNTRNQNGGL